MLDGDVAIGALVGGAYQGRVTVDIPADLGVGRYDLIDLTQPLSQFPGRITLANFHLRSTGPTNGSLGFDQGILYYSQVPEPATAAALAMAGLLTRRRPRRAPATSRAAR